MLIKRSMRIAGHRTSIALEAEFWEALAIIAARQALAMTELIARIDAERAERDPGQPLASAARVFALMHKG